MHTPIRDHAHASRNLDFATGLCLSISPVASELLVENFPRGALYSSVEGVLKGIARHTKLGVVWQKLSRFAPAPDALGFGSNLPSNKT